MASDDSTEGSDPFYGFNPLDPTMATIPGLAPMPGFSVAVRKLQEWACNHSVDDLRERYGCCRGDEIESLVVIDVEPAPSHEYIAGPGRPPKPPASGADDQEWALFFKKLRAHEARGEIRPIDPNDAAVQGKRVRGQILGEDRFVGKPYYSRRHLGAVARGLSEAIRCRSAVARQDWPAAIDAASLTALWAGWVEQYEKAYRFERAAFDVKFAAQAKASERARTPTAGNRKRYRDDDARLRERLALPENKKPFATTLAKRWIGQTEYSESVLVRKIQKIRREEKK